MPRVVEIKVYKFEELPEDVQEKVLENNYAINVEFGDWYESVYEDAKEAGIKITGFDIDRGAYCTGEFISTAEESANLIIENHGKECETYKTAFEFTEDRASLVSQMERDGDELESNYESDIEDLEEEFLKSILEDYRIMLQKEYEYLTGKEAVKETIEINEYEFLASGKMAGACIK